MKEVIEDINRWQEENLSIAFATVVQTWGSAPRKVGAKMALTPDGRIARYIFGIDYPPRDLRLALVDAAAGEIGSPADQLLLLYDYPASQAALARTRQGDGGKVAARFEVFLGSVELANGYHELGDAAEQRRRFEADRKRRAEAGQELAPLDENLLAALEHGLHECAGVALGLDRLLVAMLDDDHLDAALAFPFERA